MKNRILEFLKEGKCSISKISVNLGINYYQTQKALKELEKENKVIKELNKNKTFTYYSLNKQK